MTRGALIALIALAALRAGAVEPDIRIGDVERFYRLYDSSGGHPSADQLQHDYLDPGSEGLHHLAEMRGVTGARIAETLAKHPEIYTNARRCLAVLPRVRERVAEALRKLGQLYPEARFPPVTVAVSRGKPVGVGSPAAGVMIGLEALCATDWMNPDVEDRFVHVIAHEYAHVQQVRALVDDENPTVLEASLVEGIADLVGELISGRTGYANLAESVPGHEREIETAFLADQDDTDLSHWLYNSTADKQNDIGYWVGYRIARAYYDRAPDKKRALKELLEMTDPKAILAKSGWVPGAP